MGLGGGGRTDIVRKFNRLEQRPYAHSIASATHMTNAMLTTFTSQLQLVIYSYNSRVISYNFKRKYYIKIPKIYEQYIKVL